MNNSNAQFYILVDYDNLEKNQNLQEGDILTAISHMLNRLDQKLDFFKNADRLQPVKILLYGGWYEERMWTNKSQKIKQAISDQVSTLFTSSHGTELNVSINLSYGMLSIPGRPFFGTYRRYPGNFNIRNLYKCCDDGEVCIDFIKHVKEQNSCIYCGKDLSKLFYSNSQKMVDTIICCDLLCLSQKDQCYIAIVSSDDDLLPPIFQQSQGNDRIYHLLTRQEKGYYFTQYYDPIKPSKYKQTTW